jgi:hypothetical protein
VPVFDKKDRMVSFRLSRVEYAAAEISCRRMGVRSVSSLAREAVLDVTKATGESHAVSGDKILLQLQHEILSLRVELNKINDLITPVRCSDQSGREERA